MVSLRKAETDEQMDEAVSLLERLTDQGNAAAISQEKTWRQLRELTQERAKAASAENRMLHDRSMYVTVEQVAILIRAMLAAQKELIQDRELLRALNRRAIELVPPDLRGGVAQGDSDG